MKYLLISVLAAASCFGQPSKSDGELNVQINWAYVTTLNDNQGVKVFVTIPESAASAFIIRIQYQTESGRAMRLSKLIEFNDRYKRSVTISNTFETGVVKVLGITVDELKGTSFRQVYY